jgi:phospholipase/carboxylesterase
MLFSGDKTLALDAIAISPKTEQPPQGIFVALHGWGANYHDLATLAPFLDLPDYQMMFPNAPFPHPYAPIGRMWYGLPSNDTFQFPPDFGDYPELVESRQRLTVWLESLESSTGIPLSRTILAGFSQGGAMTLDVGSRLPLAALMVLSGYLHAPLQPQNQPFPPILMVHGRQDLVVPVVAAQQARASLTALGATVEYYELDMGHEIQPGVLDIMQSFLSKQASRLGETPETA